MINQKFILNYAARPLSAIGHRLFPLNSWNNFFFVAFFIFSIRSIDENSTSMKKERHRHHPQWNECSASHTLEELGKKAIETIIVQLAFWNNLNWSLKRTLTVSLFNYFHSNTKFRLPMIEKLYIPERWQFIRRYFYSLRQKVDFYMQI